MNWKKFKDWLKANGAEILPLTNEYETLRFRGKEVGIFYQSGKTNGSYAKNALWCFKHNESWDGRPISTGRKPSYRKEKRLLLQRDGSNCFYCGKPLNEDITLEHLIPLAQGGLNKLSNMVLAHEACNQEAGHKTIVEKVNAAIAKRSLT
jgi:hypothetical protein